MGGTNSEQLHGMVRDIGAEGAAVVVVLLLLLGLVAYVVAQNRTQSRAILDLARGRPNGDGKRDGKGLHERLDSLSGCVDQALQRAEVAAAGVDMVAEQLRRCQSLHHVPHETAPTPPPRGGGAGASAPIWAVKGDNNDAQQG